MRAFSNFLVVAMTCLAFNVSAQAPGPARAALEQFGDGLEQLQARFTQTVVDPEGQLMEEGAGEVWVSQPGLFRWSYEGEFPELIIADGERVWLYDELLEQVTVKAQSGLADNSPLMLLTDLSALDEQFIVTELGDYESMMLLELSSRGGDAEFDRVILGLAEDELRMMALEDAFGMRTEILFSDIQKNPGLDASLFRFVPPPGTDVIGEPEVVDNLVLPTP